MKIYIAGPDVFRADVVAWAGATRVLCAQRGHLALIPLDGEASTADGIFASNMAMIRQADAVIANLNFFRGAEPDSGTCFEVGVAVALGKRVVAHIDSGEALHVRLAQLSGQNLQRDGQGWLDAKGMRVENFGLPLNLMLAISADIVVGDFSAALAHLSET